jgi:hypothetical protein
MVVKLTDELRAALEQQPNRPITVEDDRTNHKYVLIPAETFEKVKGLLYDDGPFEPEEALAAVAEVFFSPEGWDAPGMEMYDNYDAHRTGS